jgi:hypothetical protein
MGVNKLYLFFVSFRVEFSIIAIESIVIGTVPFVCCLFHR